MSASFKTQLGNPAFRAALAREMDSWRANERNIPHEYIKLHEHAALADMYRMLQALNCKYAGQGLYDHNGNPHMKFLRVFADDNRTGELRQFFWSDGNGGGWHWYEGGGIRRNEPPMEDRVGYI